MRIQLLPGTFDEHGRVSQRQHLSCLVVDDAVAIDAGSLAMAVSERQRAEIRDVVLTHAHLDHIAGLPLFIDDLFAVLDEPVRVHASAEVVEVLERDVFNWSVYPRFSELSNDRGAVMEYHVFEPGAHFKVRHLAFKSISVNHKVASVGFIVADERKTFALSGDTAKMSEFWEIVNREPQLDAIFIECAFPDELNELAEISHHLTPLALRAELAKCTKANCPVFVVNIKPMYREKVVAQLAELNLANVQILEIGKIYEL